MKITTTQINLLTDAIVREIYNANSLKERFNKEGEKEWEKFMKNSKEYKALQKVFENDFITEVQVSRGTFQLGEGSVYDRYIRVHKEHMETDIKNMFINNYVVEKMKPYPDTYTLTQKIKTELTVKALGGKDIEKIMSEIAEKFKKEYNL